MASFKYFTVFEGRNSNNSRKKVLVLGKKGYFDAPKNPKYLDSFHVYKISKLKDWKITISDFPENGILDSDEI